MRRYLVVANQTLAARPLIEHARSCRADGPCWFHLVVPATPVASQLEAPIADAGLLARHRLAVALARFNAEGITATGEVGDPNPLRAVATALRHAEFDEILLSTLPIGASRWLLEDLPTRLTIATRLPVTHIAAAGERLANAP
jgi:GABA permease